MVKDERTIFVQRQAQSGGFSILYFGLLAILFYRSQFLDQSLNEYVDIFVVWLAAGVYAILSGVLRGVDPVGASGRKWLMPVVVGLAVTGIQIYNSVFSYGVDFSAPIAWIAPVLTFVFAFVFMMVVQAFLAYLYHRWEKSTLE